MLRLQQPKKPKFNRRKQFEYLMFHVSGQSPKIISEKPPFSETEA